MQQPGTRSCGAAAVREPRRAPAPLHTTLDTLAAVLPSSTVVLPKRAYAGDAKDALAARGLRQIMPGRPVED